MAPIRGELQALQALAALLCEQSVRLNCEEADLAEESIARCLFPDIKQLGHRMSTNVLDGKPTCIEHVFLFWGPYFGPYFGGMLEL